ncbi:ABC transporter permease subunit [Candidatus Chloroploca asiatica]|uniref:ABC transporter permease subunit n=1 Tax=Candidatus Chloroploca asiatica TaxID=1506545 RepID=UPI001559C243|nr:ABC transporter permease subunit [Candidatus Chloroploca asiatica]
MLAITRREVRETLGDWRVVLPMLLLTLILPQLLVAASSQVIRFVDDPDLAERLVPFAALLVGFVPASFSLITALESFVGERERNTLESLLAMPLSDNELYLGKLGSSLLTPLLSSLIAMLIFVGLLLGFRPDLYFGSMDLSRLVLLLLLVTCMAVVMVTGAVVISSHITTVRAANLMSSFILIPMVGIMQIAAFLIINGRWTELWLVAAALVVLSALLIRIGMRTFSREELLSREHLQGQINWSLPLPAWWKERRSPRKVHQARWSQSAVWLIARRELNEVITDWRVLIPLFTLIFGLPLGLLAGVNLALDFVEGEGNIARLVPFVGLLVGFVPASFALITAIESFVGERERNSLESLLAMPVSDRELYLGKLIAALIVPLVGSLTAMFTFLAAIRLVFPRLYLVGMQPETLPLLILMISVVNLLMVAGAVVISTNTSSIRAATLLASAVLVPTAVVIQLQVLLFIAQRYDVLWYVLAGLFVVALAFIRSGMAGFNREEILSREHDDLNPSHIAATLRSFFREHQPAGVPVTAYHGLAFSPRRFYRYEFPALLRELRLPILAVLLVSIGGTWLGLNFAPSILNVNIQNQLGNPPPPSFALAAFVFANNLRVSVLSNIFSVISFGIFALMVPGVAFGQIGFFAGQLAREGGNWLALGNDSPLQFLLAYVVPHGIIELPTFILSAALGLRIGAALLSPPPGFSPADNLLWALANFAKVWMLVLVPLIALGALVEGLITPRVVLMLYGG